VNKNSHNRQIGWLQQNLINHHLETFSIEALQPSWLMSKRQVGLYLIVTRLLEGVVIGGAAFVAQATIEDILACILASFVVFLIDGSMLLFPDFTAWLESLPLKVYGLGVYFAPIFLTIAVLYGYVYQRQQDSILVASLIALLYTILHTKDGAFRGTNKDIILDVNPIRLPSVALIQQHFVSSLLVSCVTSILIANLFSKHTEFDSFLVYSLIGSVIIVSLLTRENHLLPNRTSIIEYAIGINLGLFCGTVGGVIGGCFIVHFPTCPNWLALLYLGGFSGIGVGIVSVVFGGAMELLKHYILRIVLALNGLLNFNYKILFESLIALGIFNDEGDGMYKFTQAFKLAHSTLFVVNSKKRLEWISSEVDYIFNYRRFHNDQDMAVSKLQNLQSFQAFAFSPDAQVSQLLIRMTTRQKAVKLRRFLEYLVQEKLQPDSREKASEDENHWISYWILQKQYLEKENAQVTRNFIKDKIGIHVADGGQYHRLQRAAKNRLSHLILELEEKTIVS